MQTTNKPAAVKPARRINGKAPAKAGKPAAAAAPAVAKPATPAADNARAERAAATAATFAKARKLYSGNSAPVHSKRTPKLSDCIARIKSPIQTTDSATVRDTALLRLIADSIGGKPGAFDPTSPALACDLGVISRLASLSFLAVAGDKPVLTERGAAYAKAAAKAA